MVIYVAAEVCLLSKFRSLDAIVRTELVIRRIFANRSEAQFKYA